MLRIYARVNKVPSPAIRTGDIPIKHPTPLPSELRRVAVADPKIDLQNSIRSNDFRFIGILGYAVETPGITNYVTVDRIRVIEGTSDQIQSKEQEELQWKAKEYAKIYNGMLFNFLRTNQTQFPH